MQHALNNEADRIHLLLVGMVRKNGVRWSRLWEEVEKEQGPVKKALSRVLANVQRSVEKVGGRCSCNLCGIFQGAVSK